MSRLASAALLLLVGCRADLPRPAQRPMPVPDGRPALLGGQAPRSPRIASYRIAATLDAPRKTISGTATLTWRHTGAAPVVTLPLHLYMNAFKSEDSLFMRESGGTHRLGAKLEGDWGWIDLRSAMLEGVDLRPTGKFGADETVFELALPRPVAPGETVRLEMSFDVKLPRVFARTGYAGEFIMAGQWFPKIGVLVVDAAGGQRWHCAPLHLNSEFFADFGAYDVELTVPDTHVVAATGVLVGAREASPGMRTLTYRAEDVHDFAWMADPWMKVLRGTARVAGDEVEIRVYHRPGYERYAPRHLEAARRTLESWSRLLVPYPWPVMSVIDPPWEAALGAGGMEYPTLVTAGAAIPLEGQRLTEEVTVHEVTHNWFQGMLASNEPEEAWLDEGLTEYAAGVLMDEWFGEERSFLDLWGLRLGVDDRLRLFDHGAAVWPIATPSYRMSDREYGPVTYFKAAAALKTLEGMVGRARLLGALGLYARRHAFGHPTGEDLFAALRDGLGADYGWFLRPAFHESGAIDFRLGAISVAERRTTVTVERRGVVPAPVDVALRFADGETVVETWDGRGVAHTIEIERAARLVGVEIDPGGKLILEHEILDNGSGPRDSGAAWRAGARAGFWWQTLAQAVGL
jgi:hypothetical protein